MDTAWDDDRDEINVEKNWVAEISVLRVIDSPMFIRIGDILSFKCRSLCLLDEGVTFSFPGFTCPSCSKASVITTISMPQIDTCLKMIHAYKGGI